MGRDDKDRRDLHSNCSNARRFVANVFFKVREEPRCVATSVCPAPSAEALQIDRQAQDITLGHPDTFHESILKQTD